MICVNIVLLETSFIRYLAIKFQEMEDKMQRERNRNREHNESEDETSTDGSTEDTSETTGDEDTHMDDLSTVSMID